MIAPAAHSFGSQNLEILASSCCFWTIKSKCLESTAIFSTESFTCQRTRERWTEGCVVISWADWDPVKTWFKYVLSWSMSFSLQHNFFSEFKLILKGNKYFFDSFSWIQEYFSNHPNSRWWHYVGLPCIAHLKIDYKRKFLKSKPCCLWSHSALYSAPGLSMRMCN